jgi:hypothetical protein
VTLSLVVNSAWNRSPPPPSPNTTLGFYAHLFDGAEHAKRTSDLLEASFAHVLSRT